LSTAFFSIDENGNIEPFEFDLEVAQGLEHLPEEHCRYFNLEEAYEVMPLESLVSSRARTKGIKNANSFMAAAAAGTMEKRKPISISGLGGGLFKVEDGNSTLINARFSGWTSIPCRHVPAH